MKEDQLIVDKVRERLLIKYSKICPTDKYFYTGGEEIRAWMEDRLNNRSFSTLSLLTEMDEVRNICAWFPATWLGQVDLDYIETIRDR